MSLLPEDLEQRTIGGMGIGEEAWAVPWAMFADPERRLWLRKGYSSHPNRGGTVAMLIRRDRKGYHVDVSVCGSYRWELERAPIEAALPVLSLTR